jgi:hypothetical protein
MSVWTVVVAVLGFLASTAVAVAAFRASAKATQIAVENRLDARRDGRRLERRQLYDIATKWIAAEGRNVLAHGTAAFPHMVKQTADLIDSDTGHDIVWWIDNGLREVISAGATGSQERKNALETFTLLFGSNAAQWVRRGKFDWAPYTSPPP